MALRRVAYLLVLAVLPATHAWAADDEDLYHAEVCNEGQRTVQVAMAYHDWGFSSEPFWMIEYWQTVKPGNCKEVFSHNYRANNILSYQSFPLHLAFAFTDSTGAWGAAKVAPPRGVAASHERLCISRGNSWYKVEAKSPLANCPRNLQIPASIDWEPTEGALWSNYTNSYEPPKTFTVSIGANDRAIPLGESGAFVVTEQNAPNHDEFSRVLRGAMDGLPTSINELQKHYRWVNVCTDKSIAYKGGMSSSQAPRAKALTDAVQKFLPSNPGLNLRIRITESDGAFHVQRIGGKGGDCVSAGESEFIFQSPENYGLVPQ